MNGCCNCNRNPIIEAVYVDESYSDIELPKYQTEESAGMDIRSGENYTLSVGEMKLIKTGIKLNIESGWEIQVRSRSGLAGKYGIFVANSPGTVDCDYTGPCNVILFNCGKKPFEVKRGDRIAQLVVAKAYQSKVKLVNEFSRTTKRGEDGFGSTGVK